LSPPVLLETEFAPGDELRRETVAEAGAEVEDSARVSERLRSLTMRMPAYISRMKSGERYADLVPS
jgi:hypothetical protein